MEATTQTGRVGQHRVVDHPCGILVVVNGAGIECARFTPAIRQAANEDGEWTCVEHGVRYTHPDDCSSAFYLGDARAHAAYHADMLNGFEDPDAPF